MRYTRAQKAQARIEAQARLASPDAPHLPSPSSSPHDPNRIPPTDPPATIRPHSSIPTTLTDTSPIFFHREYLPPHGYLSQWFLSPFYDASTFTTYTSAEQRMMHAKALLCADLPTALAILASSSPGEQKALGRKVKGWKRGESKAKEWERIKFEVVVEGNWWKFVGGEGWLRSRLLGTGERELVEASGGDRVWGVGFGEGEAERRRGEWGMNLLGRR